MKKILVLSDSHSYFDKALKIFEMAGLSAATQFAISIITESDI